MARKAKRTVSLSDLVVLGTWRSGRQPRLWAFGYADLAVLWGCSERTARQVVRDGLDPTDLEAVCRRAHKLLLR